MGSLIDGKALAGEIQSTLAPRAARLRELGRPAHLTAIMVGHDPSSASYIRAKQRACSEIGIESEVVMLPSEITQSALMEKVKELGKNRRVCAILVQLPLPKHINPLTIIMAIPPEKDVDGFHPENLGHLIYGSRHVVSCTPAGILEMLTRYKISLKGRHVVIVGRSPIVGAPLAALLSQETADAAATVTSCHRYTENLENYVQQADVLVLASGDREAVKGRWIKDNAVVIDVGIHLIPDKTKKSGHRLVGDVDWHSLIRRVSFITPVPGGVGPMTVAMLLCNTVQLAEEQLSKVK